MRKLLTPDSGIPSCWEVEVTLPGQETKTSADVSLYSALVLAFFSTKIAPMEP